MTPTLVRPATRPVKRPPADDRDFLIVGADPDGTAEEHLGLAADADREEPGVFEKERALFGKEQVETIEIDLLRVHFDLGEVCVVCRIERQAGRKAVFQIHAEVAVLIRASTRDRAILLTRSEQIRCQLKVPLDWNRKTRQSACQRQPVQIVLPR